MRLFRYSLLAMVSYQIPMAIAYLAKYLGITGYEYKVIYIPYFLFLTCSITALSMIRIKKNISRGFIHFILHYQVVFCLVVAAYMTFAMDDQRHLVPIGCLLVLIFVFIQSPLFVSFAYIALQVILYMSASYLGIRASASGAPFLSEVLYIFMYVPICLFMAYLSKIMQDQRKKINNANTKLKSAHTELETTYSALENAHEELESHNERMVESIRYAEMIQRSLLPGLDRLKAVSPDSMFIWMPKDIVGGDIFYTYTSPERSIIALMDCTGHGVPGAFLTMIAYSEIRKIVLDDAYFSPSDILQRLNRAVKNVLHKSAERSETDDGLDAAICQIDHINRKVIYAGARLPLFYVKNQMLHRKNGDKHSIGYKDSDEHFHFTDHVITVGDRCSFYLKTDGFTDQLGGVKNLRFGTKRYTAMIMDHYDKSYGDQRKIFLKTLLDYKGAGPQIDDITLIGFSVGGEPA